MWTARNKCLRADPDRGFRGVDKEGLVAALKHYNYAGAVIIGSSLMHYSFKKAADLLGLGDEGLCLVSVNDQYQIDCDELESRILSFRSRQYLILAVVGIVGTTEVGSIDSLEHMARITHRYGIHFHVDAAWGGPLIFSKEHAPKLRGIQAADTITVDGHKQLYTPMGLGLVLFKDPNMASFIRKTAAYVIRHGTFIIFTLFYKS